MSRRGVLKAAAATIAASSVMSLTGCGNSGTKKNDKALTFWNFYGDNGEGTLESQWFIDLVEQWNENNATQINLRYIPVSQYMDGTTLQTAFTSGAGPDIFIISPGDFLRFANNDALLDLTDFIAAEARADFNPGVLASRMDDDRIFAVPMDAEPLGIYYSIEAFEKAGLSEADVPKTWDEMLNIADKLTTDKQFGMCIDTNPSYYQNFTWYPFMWQTGADVFDGNRVVFDSSGTRDALNFWKELVHGGMAPKTPRGDGGADVPANLGAGFCAMQQSGIWGIAALEQNDVDTPYGVTHLPIPEGGKQVTDVGGWAFAANAKGANPEAAGQFIAWALAGTSDADKDRLLNWNTEAKSNLPTRESVIDLGVERGVWTDGPSKFFAQEIANTGRAEPRFPPEVYKPISDAIQAVVMNGEDPGVHTARAQSSIEQFMSNYNGIGIG